MKSRRFLFLVCVAALPLLFAFDAGDGDFKLVKRDKAIALYERWIKRSTASEEVREIKAVFHVKSTIDAIVKLLADPQQGTNWNINAKTFQVIPITTRQQWITYVRYTVPWPFDDQDCCLQYNLSPRAMQQSSAELHFESATHEKFPVQNKVTRLSGIRGKWLLTQHNNGSTEIIYTVTTDRSVKVPRWISDPVVRNNLFETMTAFKNLLEKQ